MSAFMRYATMFATLALAAVLVAPRPVSAQALCSLRNPKRQIFGLFPEADGFRSIVGTVGKDTRRHIAEALPFTLHFNELGRHTLYVAYRDGVPLGLVHSRSEAGRWGLVEIAWGLDLDLNVVGLEFQRCRDRAKASIDDRKPEAKLKGLGFDEIRALLDKSGTSLRSGVLSLPDASRPLGLVVARNALKTISTTEHVWSRDIWQLRALAMAQRSNPSARVATAVDEARIDRFQPGELSDLGILADGVLTWRVRDEEDRHVGSVVRMPWRMGDDRADILWWVSKGASIDDVAARSGWSSPAVREAFEATRGMSLGPSADCAGAAHLIACAALRIAAEPVPKAGAARGSRD